MREGRVRGMQAQEGGTNEGARIEARENCHEGN
jgi:hypothetical protein